MMFVTIYAMINNVKYVIKTKIIKSLIINALQSIISKYLFMP